MSQCGTWVYFFVQCDNGGNIFRQFNFQDHCPDKNKPEIERHSVVGDDNAIVVLRSFCYSKRVSKIQFNRTISAVSVGSVIALELFFISTVKRTAAYPPGKRGKPEGIKLFLFAFFFLLLALRRVLRVPYATSGGGRSGMIDSFGNRFDVECVFGHNSVGLSSVSVVSTSLQSRSTIALSCSTFSPGIETMT